MAHQAKHVVVFTFFSSGLSLRLGIIIFIGMSEGASTDSYTLFTRKNSFLMAASPKVPK